jgi:two-component system, NtrC family, response regulator HydG
VASTRLERARDSQGSGGLHILVVDDDPETRTLVAASVASLGTVECCSDAYQALALLQAEPFDVVVLELLLPGASGVDFMERLAATSLHIPVVVVSASGTEGVLADRARDAGATAVMEKPLDARLLALNVTRATQWVNR